MRRKAISARLRFAVLHRDKFTCRYCGATASEGRLVLDHVIPVAEGGETSEENLITACERCNQGKAARSLDTPPTSPDWEALAAKREAYLVAQRQQAEAAKKAVEAREAFYQDVVDLWCQTFERETVSRLTIQVMVAFAREHGIGAVAEWLAIAKERLGVHASDSKLGRYVSGIRRRTMEGG